ncbi:MAG: response regulator [Hyphomicrobiaceae bacterium]
MTETSRIALVDDDDGVLDALSALMRKRGFEPFAFASAKALVTALEKGDVFDCIVTDIRMPSVSGNNLHQLLKERGSLTPVIFITGHGDIDLAVASIKSGVSDFIEKPINSERLISSIREAIERARATRHEEHWAATLRQRYGALSDRQREVMLLAASGRSNKEIAAILNLSARTVEHYREWVMGKMQAQNLADLVQMAMLLKLLSPQVKPTPN